LGRIEIIIDGECMSNIQKLDELRSKIDIIDIKIFELLIQREDFSAEIGNIKQGSQKEIFDRKRESKIFSNLELKCREKKIDFEYIKDIWNIIINKSHEVQIKGK
jgi:chorismate mutase